MLDLDYELDTVEMVANITRLKAQRDAVILAHNYERGEVQDIADFVGDSLELSLLAAKLPQKVIVFCGVHFMAETAAVISPDKIVLMPDKGAGCPMANMITAPRLRAKKAEHPNAVVVAYVNTSAAVKAECDVCCTSANALKIVEALPNDEILFVPDQSLGAWVAERSTKKFILWAGFCPTHHRILGAHVDEARAEHPNALVIAHPESTTDVRNMADIVLGTGAMIRYAKESPAREFIVATEQGMLHRLRKEVPDKQFFTPSELNVCPNMKRTTLAKIENCLETMETQVSVPPEIADKARRPIEKMLEII